MPQAENRAGEAAAHDDGTTGRAPGNRRQDDRIGVPLDVRRLAAECLAVAPLRLALERPHRGTHFGKIFKQQVVLRQLELDAGDRLGREVRLGGEDRAESSMAVEHGPEQRVFRDRGFCESAVDRVDESAAAEDAVLHAADYADMVVGKWRKAGRLREILNQKLGEIEPAGFAAIGVDRLRDFADVRTEPAGGTATLER